MRIELELVSKQADDVAIVRLPKELLKRLGRTYGVRCKRITTPRE